MKLTINRKRLAEVVAIVSPATGRLADAVVSGIKLEADDLGRLVASATDYEVEIQTWAEADVAEPGAIVVQGALLGRALSVLAGDTVTLTAATGGGGGVLECGAARFEFNGYAVDEFPEIHAADPPTGARVEMPRDVLAAGLAATLPFVMPNDTRPALRAVSLRIDGGLFAFAATDGHRLGFYDGQLPQDVGRASWLIVPSQAAAIADALGRTDAAPWFDVEGRRLRAVVGPTAIMGRLSDEQFPDYRRVVPAVAERATVTVDRAALRDTIRRVQVLAERDKEGLMQIAMTIGGAGGVTVTTAMAGVGKARDALDLFNPRPDGRIVCVALSPGFVIQALDVFKASPTVAIQVVTPEAPVLFTAPDAPRVGHVCMPMRMQAATA